MAARDQGSADGADKPGLPEVSGRPGSIAGRGRLVGGGAAAAPFRPTGPGSLSPAGRGSSGVPLDTGVPVVPVGRRQVVPGAAPVEQPARWCRTGRPGCCDVGTAAGYAAAGTGARGGGVGVGGPSGAETTPAATGGPSVSSDRVWRRRRRAGRSSRGTPRGLWRSGWGVGAQAFRREVPAQGAGSDRFPLGREALPVAGGQGPAAEDRGQRELLVIAHQRQVSPPAGSPPARTTRRSRPGCRRRYRRRRPSGTTRGSWPG